MLQSLPERTCQHDGHEHHPEALQPQSLTLVARASLANSYDEDIVMATVDAMTRSGESSDRVAVHASRKLRDLTGATMMPELFVQNSSESNLNIGERSPRANRR